MTLNNCENALGFASRSSPAIRETTTQAAVGGGRGRCLSVSVNAMLAAVNKLLTCMGWEDCKVRYLRTQRQMFRKAERELTRAEYQRLLESAQARSDARLLLLLETLCVTGIRVSELQYITMEVAQNGVAEIALKGKSRTILLPTKLCHKLLKYAKKRNIR